MVPTRTFTRAEYLAEVERCIPLGKIPYLAKDRTLLCYILCRGVYRVDVFFTEDGQVGSFIRYRRVQRSGPRVRAPGESSQARGLGRQRPLAPLAP